MGARPAALWSLRAPAPGSGCDQRDRTPCGNCTGPRALSGSIPKKVRKISALAKIIAPRICLVWLPPCRLALTGCPLPLRSFQMDEMGTEPSQARREALGRAPSAGSSRRRAATRAAPGREGGSPRLASQVTSSSNPPGSTLARASRKFPGPPRFRVFRLLAANPRAPETAPSGSRLPFPALFSRRQTAALLLRKPNIKSNSSSGARDKARVANRRGLSSRGQRARVAPLRRSAWGRAGGAARRVSCPLLGPPRAALTPALSSCLAAAGRMLTSASSATARALTASPTSKPSARGAASGRARCRSWPTRSTS